MEIARIVILDGSLLREDRDEYIAAGCDNGWRNAVYRTTSLEVYFRACQAVYRALDRKVDQCVGRVDVADIRDRPREYGITGRNPERSRSRQSSQRLRPIESWHLAIIDTLPLLIIHVVIHKIQRFRTNAYTIVINLRVWTLTEATIPMIIISMSVSSNLSRVYFSMASYVKPGKV